MASLVENFLHLQVKNPLVLASGVMGTSPNLMMRCAQAGAGAVTSKSCGLEARAGHENPVAFAWDGGVINAIGLTNPGARKEMALLRDTRNRLAPLGVPLFASIFAHDLPAFGEVARIVAEATPDLIEVNISCPNVANEFGMPFSSSAKSAAAVTREVRRAVDIPISIKLAPNVPDIGRIAQAVAEEGADAITAVNTMPAMLIDAFAAKPMLNNHTGGLSGAALKPIALRCVAEVASRISLPIIGTGGVSHGLDAVEIIMAGATLVGVGSAIWQAGAQVMSSISSEIQHFMEAEGYHSLEEMRGRAIR